jgi:lipopolysaccharide/colanic/teichoic acid biosynthesis glycosyltransferase
MVLTPIVILIEEPGAIFYRGRTGRLESPHIQMFILRTMRFDACGGKLTLPRDPRFTRIGGLLAPTRLDERPQLLNVLRGEMVWSARGRRTHPTSPSIQTSSPKSNACDQELPVSRRFSTATSPLCSWERLRRPIPQCVAPEQDRAR